MTRDSGKPVLIADSQIVALEPVELLGTETKETWLQGLLDRAPALIPIDDVGQAWGPLVSLGRELLTSSGPIDNMFVSPTGELTIVETKLWRNPEARRKVIGQILDYAAALSGLTYDELDQLIQRHEPDRGGLWARVCASESPPPEDGEGRFVDTVSRNLLNGAFLLLVIGDGIREDLEGIARLLQNHQTLRFHLELIELRIFRQPGSAELFVVPSVVGRTREVTRAVVEVVGSSVGRSQIVVAIPPEDPDERASTTKRIASLDEFVERASEHMTRSAATGIADLARWWKQCGGRIKFNKQSLNFAAPCPSANSGLVSVLTIYVHGIAEGSVAPMSDWSGAVVRDVALREFQSAGFDGDGLWPRRREFDLSRADEQARFKTVLSWAFDALSAI